MQQDPNQDNPNPVQPREYPYPVQSPYAEKQIKRREGIKSALSTILILALAPLIAWLMISFVFQSYEVDGPSMEKTLQHHDRLIVVKAGRTFARLTDKDYIPKRGEIIVFTKLGLTDYGDRDEKQLIKRVIGVPGDRVVVVNGSITVYNADQPRGFNPDETGGYGDTIGFTSGNVDITVPEGEVFVAGDNRANSLDSRTFGTISSNEIIGKLAVRIFPLNKAKNF